ncbi:fish-egg lectin-like [Menidia menidia]
MKSVAAFFLFASCLSISHAWTCREGPQLFPASQIDAGQGKVVLRDRYSKTYFLSGSSWYRLGSVSLKHITTGAAGIWGVDYADRVHKYIAGEFVRANGQTLSQVDAGGTGQVVGVSRSDTIHCLRSSYANAFKQVSTLSWNTVPGGLNHVSCSPTNQCWGVNRYGQIFYTTISSTCSAGHWTYVSGLTARVLEVGHDGSVFVVDTSGLVHQRIGISYPYYPTGRYWSNIRMCVFAHDLSYDLGSLWIVSKGGMILKCSH